MPNKRPKTMGRPPFNPNDEQRRLVKTMASFGIPQPAIASHMRIAATTLRRHFRDELDLAACEANLSVLSSLFTMATTRHNVAAAIFWAKTRCGFRSGGVPVEPLPPAAKPKRSPQHIAFPNPPPGFTVYNNDGEPNGSC